MALALGALLLLAAPRARAAELVLVGGRVHTGDGASIENGLVAIAGDRIARVGPVGAAPPEGALRLPPGAVITPGFIDPDTTVGLFNVSGQGDPRDDQAPGEEPVHPAFDAFLAFDPGSLVIPTVRMAGITTVGISPQNGIFRGRTAFADLWGEAATEMLVRAPAALYIAGGPAAGPRGMSWARIREVLDDAREWSRRKSDWERNALRALSAGRVQLEALQPALRGELPVMIQAQRASDIVQALQAGRDYGLRLVITGAAEGWRVAGELARARAPVIVDPFQNLPADFDTLHARSENAALLHAAGVKVMLSTMGAPHFVRRLPQQAGNAVRAGLPWEAALAAVTRVPAEVFSLPGGVLAPGKIANVVVWSGDPFELSTRPLHVFIRGREVPLASRQTALFEKYRARILGGR